MKKLVFVIGVCLVLVSCNCKNKKCEDKVTGADSAKTTVCTDSMKAVCDTTKNDSMKAACCKIGDKKCCKQ